MEILNTGTDWVAAEILSNRTAIIKGISQDYEIGYEDIVLFDPSTKSVTQIIKKNTNTVYVKFKENLVNFDKMDVYFKKNDIHIESIMSGLSGLAIPVNISDEDFQIIFYNCPVNCELLTEEDTDVKDIDENDNDDCFI